MRVEKINSNTFNQNFNAKKFRVPVKISTIDRSGIADRIKKKPGKWVQEYSNPKAEEIYKKAMGTEDLFKSLHLLRSMGAYELKDTRVIVQIKEWYNKNILQRILKDEWK